MGFYEDIEKGLLEAIVMEKGEFGVVKKDNMSATTYIANDIEKVLLDEIICIRKEQNVSQSELANLIGSKHC